MKIFKVTASTQNGYPMIDYSKGDNGKYNNYELGQMLTGEKPMDCSATKYVNYSVSKKFGNFDVLHFSGGLIVSEKAYIFMEKEFIDLEFCPLLVNNEKYYLMNVNNIRNCLDQNKSTIEYFDSGLIMRISKYSFDQNKVPTGPLLFKLKERMVHVLATEACREKLESSSLIGFDFIDLENPREGYYLQ